MVGLREHIDGLGCNQAITATRAKRRYVARQGAGLARNVANSTRTKRLQCLQRFGVAARATRVNPRQVNTLTPVVSLTEEPLECAVHGCDIVLGIDSCTST